MPEPNDSLDSILDLDGPQDPPAPPPEAGAGGGDSTPTKSEERMAALEKNQKDLQEQNRQLTETNKTLQQISDNFTGNTPEAIAAREHQEKLKKIDKDPVAYIDAEIEKRAQKSDKALALESQTGIVHRSIASVNKDFIVDWNKDYEKINKKLATFSQEAIDKDPKGTLIAACELARCIKRKAASSPPDMGPKGRPGEAPSRKASPSEEEEVNKRLDSYSRSKSKNVFGINTKEEPKTKPK